MNLELLKFILSDKESIQRAAVEAREITEKTFKQFPLKPNEVIKSQTLDSLMVKDASYIAKLENIILDFSESLLHWTDIHCLFGLGEERSKEILADIEELKKKK